MPRVYRTQRERERFLILEFVEHLGYRVSSPRWPDRPDAVLTLSNADERKRIAIEITDHFTDTTAGKASPLNPISVFWRMAESSLIRRISHRKHLSGIVGRIRFKQALSVAANRSGRTAVRIIAKQLASEMVDLLEGYSTDESEWHFLARDNFDRYPSLARLVESLMFTRATEEHLIPVRGSWTCSNTTTGHITVSLDYLKSSVAQKNKKAVKYNNWGSVQEKWLLIVAGGGDVNTHAPRRDLGIRWEDPQLQKLCDKSPFDRIVFWERVGRWQKWLKT